MQHAPTTGRLRLQAPAGAARSTARCRRGAVPIIIAWAVSTSAIAAVPAPTQLPGFPVIHDPGLCPGNRNPTFHGANRLIPIFDKNTLHVGWYGDGNVFDVNIEWVAFERDGHLFSADTLAWLGPFVEGSLLDRDGRPVGWLTDTQPTGIGHPMAPASVGRPPRPMRPKKPIAPRRPLFPRMPLQGWSAASWEAWLGKPSPASNDGQPEAPADG